MLEKCQQIPKYEIQITKARKDKNFKAEFSLLAQRAEIYAELGKWKEASNDYLYQLKILTKTTENVGELSAVYEGLGIFINFQPTKHAAFTQLEQKEYEKSIHSYRQLFQQGTFDYETKALHLFNYAKALSLNSSVFALILLYSN